MGSTYSNVREEAEKENKKSIVETLDNLVQLGDAKANLFYAKLKNTDTRREYHISKVHELETKTFVSAGNLDHLLKEAPNQIKGAVSSMMSGDWLGGIISLFETTLKNVYHGEAHGSMSEKKNMYVFAYGIGLNRVDFYIFSKSIQHQTEHLSNYRNILVVAYVVSSLNTKNMTLSDLNSIVSKKAFYDDQKNEIKDQLKLADKQMEYARKLAVANGIALTTGQEAQSAYESPSLTSPQMLCHKSESLNLEDFA